MWNKIGQVLSAMSDNRSYKFAQICASSFKQNEISIAVNSAIVGMKYVIEASKEMENVM